MKNAAELKYEVIMLGPDKEARRKHFENLFEARVRELGLDPGQLTDVVVGSTGSAAVRAVVWCGSNNANPSEDVQLVKEFLADGVSVFPVVDSLDSFPKLVPAELSPINGVTWDRGYELVSAVLVALGLLRAAKRVFISYRRDESQAVADQLFEKLQRRGYSVFLDTASIELGKDFQDHLKSHLVDTDVVIFLHTTNALNSGWIIEELLSAQQRGTEVLEVLWPGVRASAELGLGEQRQLDETDLTDADKPPAQRLADDFVESFIPVVEQARVLSVKTRRDRVLNQLADDAEDLGIDLCYYATGRHGFADIPFVGYSKTTPKDVASMVIVSPGIPTATELQDGQSAIDGARESFELDSENVRIVYDEFGLLDIQFSHLSWLNDLIGVNQIQFVSLGEHYLWLKSRNLP